MVSLPVMSHADQWREAGHLARYLGNQLQRGRLALFLGAGISSPLELPGWKVLVERMYQDAGKVADPASEPQLQAEVYKREHCSGDDSRYLSAVRTALYRDTKTDLKDLEGIRLLRALAALTMSSRRGSATVVTFNFDDLLERYLTFHGFSVRPVFEPKSWASNADISIYHPHGFLPWEPRYQASRKIVLALDEFDDAVGRDSWSWKPMMSSILRSHTCLFIGLSGNDHNLTSLLTETKPVHACTTEQTLYWGVSFGTGTSRHPVWEGRNIYQHLLTSYDELPDFLFRICQNAADFSAQND